VSQVLEEIGIELTGALAGELNDHFLFKKYGELNYIL
jgi:hypothetical protein